jgi:hypothetical protein
MTDWTNRTAHAAGILQVAPSDLAAFLDRNGIVSPDDALAVNRDDFKASLLKRFPDLTPLVADRAIRELGERIDEQMPTERLLRHLASGADPELQRRAHEILTVRPIRNRAATWGDAAFVVLQTGPGGRVDVDATRQVMRDIEELRHGDLISPRGVFIRSDARRCVVHRLSDVRIGGPSARRLKDPLDPPAILDPLTKFSRRFRIRIDLPEDRHQVLLFAIDRGLMERPGEREAREILDLVARAESTAAAAAALGEDVALRWEVARHADPASPASLPSIWMEADAGASESPAAGGQAMANPSPATSMSASAVVVEPVASIVDATLARRISSIRNVPWQEVLTSLRADTLRSGLHLLGHVPRGSSKADLARQVLGLDPTMGQVVQSLVIDPLDGQVNDEAFTLILGEPYVGWRDRAVARVLAERWAST